MLDRSSWARVMTSMEREMKKSDYAIEKEDWYTLQRYYLNNAPLVVERPGPPVARATGRFQPSHLTDGTLHTGHQITLLTYDKGNNVLITGDIGGRITMLTRDGDLTRNHIDNIPIHAQRGSTAGSFEVLGMGSFYPSEALTGALIRVDSNGKQQVLIDSLKRPVHFQRVDLDGNGSEEYLIASFGSTQGLHNSGKLSMYSMVAGNLEETVLLELPGALRSETVDLNRDGLTDIVALFAQGREVVMLFINQGGLNFEQSLLLEFPPVYGTNSFTLVDMNDDGALDIVLTNGDNGDSSPIFKPYHGVRIFLNDGSNHFTEAYFSHINGASDVVVKDYDLDGDPDLVVLAMYPDLFTRPWESLVYFEHNGHLEFELSYLEKEASAQWLLLDAGDIDGDGDDDIVTGANRLIQALFPPRLTTQWDSTRITTGIFKNTTH
jgi:hypothetical protein